MENRNTPTYLSLGFIAAVIILLLGQYLLSIPALFIIAILVGILGLAAIAAALYKLAKDRNFFYAIHALFVVGVWSAWILLPTDQMGISVRFWVERPTYEAAIAETKDGKIPQCVASRKCKYEPTSSAPLAFPWDGIIDNWYGVVYDPTGKVDSEGQFKGIFGGDLVGCRHLNGHYFFCSFT